MKTNNFFSKAAKGVLIMIYLAMMTSQTNAELYTFEFTSDSYVAGTTHINGSFDIKAKLSSIFGSQAYSIENAQLTFYFTDDNTGDITTQTVQTTDWTGSNETGFDRDKTTFKPDEGETAGVLIEGVTFSKSPADYTVVNSTGTEITSRPYQVQTGTTQVQTGTTQVYAGSYCCHWNWIGSCNGYCSSYNTVPVYSDVPVYTTFYAEERTHLKDSVSGANGDFTLTIDATAAMLNRLKTYNYLGFDVSSSQGDFKFLRATLSANITGINQTVSFTAGTGGTVTGSTPQTVKNGSGCTEVTSVPKTGYKFVNWTGSGGFAATTTNPLTVSNVTTDMTITANFQTITQTITFAAGVGGTLTGTTTQTVSYYGNCSEVTAVPSTGYTFVNWTGTGGFSATTTNPVTVSNVTADMMITANFKIVLPGDANGNEKVDLADAILALQIVAGINSTQTINPDADINSDEKIGMEEVVYILQKVAGLRQ